MEFCSGGSCSDLMRPGQISEDYIMIILRELLRGLEYLHNDQKLHRDVKGTAICSSRDPRRNADISSRKHPFNFEWPGKIG